MKSTLATNLGILRKELKLSQREVAKVFGISQALLSHYENDTREPGIEFIIKACKYYKVTADFLIGISKTREDKAYILSSKVNETINLLEQLRTQEDNIIKSIREISIEE